MLPQLSFEGRDNLKKVEKKIKQKTVATLKLDETHPKAAKQIQGELRKFIQGKIKKHNEGPKRRAEELLERRRQEALREIQREKTQRLLERLKTFYYE